MLTYAHRLPTNHTHQPSQVFGDEFHIATLEQFLTACTQLKEKVNVRAILEGMMDRLAVFAESNPDAIPADLR